MVASSSLSFDDVSKLLSDPSAENRAATAAKVSAKFSAGELQGSARTMAEEIFRIMVHDAEVRVRQALADSLKDNPEIPHEVARTLAEDVAEVALPILECSKVLSDADLEEIINTCDETHQIAIAGRHGLSESVADSLAATHNEDVVATLVSNEEATLTERTLQKVLDEFGDSEKVNKPMVFRGKLPVTVAERLVTLVSDTLQQHIVTHHEISPDLATDLLMESREKATIGLLDGEAPRGDMVDLVNQLHENGRLTPTLVLRAVCMGDVNFFETSLAKRAGIPVANAYALIEDDGQLGLESLFKKAGMPNEMVDLARTAINVKRETHHDCGDNDQTRFRQRMIERVLTTTEDGIDPENLDYLISKLGSAKAVAA